MTNIWLELIFLIVVLISLKVAKFTNQSKLIVFLTYIISGILTKLFWIPAILFVAMYIYFNQTDTE
ncbi:MAG: hypothetical protein R3F25_00905 [Gammaproteobacteria bacterium]